MGRPRTAAAAYTHRACRAGARVSPKSMQCRSLSFERPFRAAALGSLSVHVTARASFPFPMRTPAVVRALDQHATPRSRKTLLERRDFERRTRQRLEGLAAAANRARSASLAQPRRPSRHDHLQHDHRNPTNPARASRPDAATLTIAKPSIRQLAILAADLSGLILGPARVPEHSETNSAHQPTAR